jgi:hypothetical protein
MKFILFVISLQNLLKVIELNIILNMKNKLFYSYELIKDIFLYYNDLSLF